MRRGEPPLPGRNSPPGVLRLHCDAAGLPGSLLRVHERTDAELVAAVLNGNGNAYGALVRRYQDAYFRFATRMLGSHEDADDALQSAFIRAHHSLSQCNDPARFGAWLYRIVVNECRTYAARRARRERHMAPDTEALANVAVQHPESRSADMEEIQGALERLDVDQREAFLLKHVEELEYDHMAAITGASISALKMRVKRARDRLRELLEEAWRVS